MKQKTGIIVLILVNILISTAFASNGIFNFANKDFLQKQIDYDQPINQQLKIKIPPSVEETISAKIDISKPLPTNNTNSSSTITKTVTLTAFVEASASNSKTATVDSTIAVTANSINDINDNYDTSIISAVFQKNSNTGILKWIIP